MLDSLHQDLCSALRSLRSQPRYVAVTVLTLVLGVGANTAVFSVANAVLLRPLNLPAPERLVRVTTTYARSGRGSATLPHFNVLRDQSGWFDGIAAHRLDFINVESGPVSEQLPVARVTAGFFDLFGARIIHGRAMDEADDRPGKDRPVWLGHGLWVRQFGADPNVVGKVMMLAGQPHQIAGIVDRFDPEQFDQLPDVWLPFRIDPETRDAGGEFCFITVRLQPGVSMAQAEARLATATADYQRRFPGRIAPTSEFAMLPIRDAIVGNIRVSLAMLMAVVVLVLLIACANLASLVLVRSAERRREFGVRTALGASRLRLARQLLLEHLAVSIVGGVLGSLTGIVGVRVLLSLYPSANPFVLGSASVAIPRIGEHGTGVTADWRVLLFTLVTIVLTTAIFGVVGSVEASRTDVVSAIKTGPDPRRASARFGIRSVLVAFEVAMAVTLVVGATLLVRTSIALHAINPGFSPDGVLTLRMSIADTAFETQSGITRLTRQGTRRVEAIPGVSAVGTSCCVPFETVWQLPFRVASQTERSRGGLVGWTFVSPGYFSALGIPLVRGREFTDRDDATAPGAVIINEAMARLYWPDRDPLQDSLQVGRGVRPDYDRDPIRRVVGIVGDVRDSSLRRNARPAMYVPVAQVPDGVTSLNVRLLPLTWFVRTSRTGAIQPVIEEALRAASGGLPLGRVRSMRDVMSESIARTRFDTSLMTIFGAVALVLAAIGIYGLLAQSVQARRPEIGIRIALGANPDAIGRMVVFQGLRLVAIGSTAGLIASWNLTKVLEAVLFGVAPRDLRSFAIGASLLAGTAMVALIIPAVRATRTDPVAVLRGD